MSIPARSQVPISHEEVHALGIRDSSFGYVKRLSFIREAIASHYPQIRPAELTILDVGCGTGNMVARPLGALGYGVHGIDIHSASIDYARKQTVYPNVHFDCLPVTECPTAAYDVVVVSEVLEHVRKYEALFGDCCCRLKPGGLLIVTVPNGFGCFEVLNFVWRRIEQFKPVIELRERRRKALESFSDHPFLDYNCVHVNFFTMPRIIRLFEAYGFNIARYECRTFLCGLGISFMIDHLGLCPVNRKLGTLLPFWLVSGWMFALQKQGLRQPVNKGGRETHGNVRN